MNWDINTATLLIAFYAMGATFWAAREQRENNKLERRNGDLLKVSFGVRSFVS